MAQYKPLSWFQRLQSRLWAAYWHWRTRHVDYVSMREEQQRSFYQWSQQATPDFLEDDWQEAQWLVQQDIDREQIRAEMRRVQALTRLPVMYDDTWNGAY